MTFTIVLESRILMSTSSLSISPIIFLFLLKKTAINATAAIAATHAATDPAITPTFTRPSFWEISLLIAMIIFLVDLKWYSEFVNTFDSENLIEW